MAEWKANYDKISFVVTATELSTNIENNTSEIQIVAEFKADRGTAGYNGYPQTVTIKVGNTTVADLSGITYSLSNGGIRSLGTWTTTINRDTYESTVPIVAEASDVGYLGESDGVTATINKSLSLSEIARESIPSLHTTSITFGNDVRIYTNRQNTSYTHTMVYRIGTKEGLVANNVGSYHDWTPPNSLAETFPDSLSGTVDIEVTTFNGSNELGTNTVRLTLSIDTNSTAFKPHVNPPTLEERNSLISSNIGDVWVQGQSRVNIIGGSLGRYGAKIVSGAIIMNPGPNQQRASADLNTEFETLSQIMRFTTAGTFNIALEVVDSRGLRTTSDPKTIEVVAYNAPILSDVTAHRDPDSPTDIVIGAKGVGSHLGNENTLTLSAHIRPATDTVWDDTHQVVSNTSTNGSVSISNQSFSGYSEALSYEIKIELKDKLTSSQVSIVTIGTTSVLLDAYKDVGMAIGKLYEPEYASSLQVGEKGLRSSGPIRVGDESVMYVQENGIYNGADLNNFTESGIYTINNNSQGTIVNAPSSFQKNNIALYVIKVSNTVTIQWFMYASAATEDFPNHMPISYRHKYANFWLPWKTL
ncbi:DUF859 family phage minor structural protein [Ruoffia tabacinasalis]|uniref:Uncharacterized protein n=1 Tax=Ruoffia tabacinasalis TaxID=87458 RepID=A0ABS0LGG0_9LACT|nr:DUF859 family phage minor structural protein [Ruoffia tabacinasalis]MBG9977223.1 hypothetical protein [Ruoffia tabacinasalis]